MMQFDENPEVQEAGASKASTVDYISGAKIVEGITTSVTNFTENLSKGITNVDNVMQSFVNQMGQGKGLAEEIRREYAGAAEEIIKLGGTQKEAAEVQTKTLDVLGRNVILSKEQSTELFAANKISGVAIEKLEKGFIDAGKSIKDIGKEMLLVREISNNMGVNAKAVSALVVENLGKLNRYGFQNGVEGLAKMAASSQALGIDMNATLDLADDLTSPERAMEVAAMFQRMGSSSAALTNPLKLIDLSMNNTEKLQEELGDYFKTFAKFDEKTGQFGIAKSERLKIKELSQALQIPREQIEKMALASADLDRKLSKISFAGFNVDEETKQMVANMSVMGEGGEYVIQTKAVDKDGKPTGELIRQSIQDFLTSTKGDKDAIKEALGTTEESTTRPIEQIAEEQLSYSQKIDANIKLLVEQPGLTAGARKAGKQLLEGTYEATKAVNEPFQKRLDSDSKIAKELDKFGVKLEEGITTLKEGGGYQDLLDVFKNQGAEFGKTAVTELTAGGIEVLAKLGDLTGLSQLFQELELTKDVKEILEKIKEEDGDLSDEAKKYFDDLLKEIEKKEEQKDQPPTKSKEDKDQPPTKSKEDKDQPPTKSKGEIDGDRPPTKSKEQIENQKTKGDLIDEGKAKETIEKLGNKAGELYDGLKSSILDFFKEIVTDKIDVNELNVIGETKNNLKTTSVTESQTTLEPTITEINPQEALVEIQPTETISPQKVSKEEESIKSIGKEEVKPKENVIGTELGVRPEGLQQVKLVEILPVNKIETGDIVTDRIIIQGGVDLANLVTTKTEEPKTIATPPVTTPTPLINTKTIDEIVLSNTNSSEILKSFEKSSKEIGELKIGEEPKKVELAGPKQEKGFTGFEPKILSTISEKDKTILSKLSQEIVENTVTTEKIRTDKSEQGLINPVKLIETVKSEISEIQESESQTTIEGINTSNQTLSTNFKSEIEKIKDLKITSNTKEITNLGNYIKDISSEVKSSQEKTQESQSIFLDSANNVFENQSESTKSFIENNTKELPTNPKTNEGEDVMSKYSVIDKDGNKTISPMGRRVMKQLSEKEKEYEGEKGGFLDKILPKEQTIEAVKDLKITSDSTETIKLGKNVENIFTKFENQSDSVKSILEKNSKSTDIFTELSNTNKTILEKTKDEGTNVKTSILNETTDTFINKINEGVEIANKTEEKKNQLSEIQNTITDKDFEKRVAISESLIRDLDITKEQLKISTENALLVEKEKENVETISNFKESDFDKRVEESESLISALDKEIEKQKNVESTVDSTKTLTEQMSNLYKEENFLTVTKPIDAVENKTETNVINASPIQPTIAPIELANKNVKPEELSTKVQDFLANQPKQVVETGTNEPIKIETKLTIDGDPRFASLLDARKLQETVEGVMTKSINKPQFAQKISTGTQRANMGMT